MTDKNKLIGDKLSQNAHQERKIHLNATIEQGNMIKEIDLPELQEN